MRAAMRSIGDERVQFELTATGYEPEIDTDQGAVNAGFASITTVVGVTEAWSGPMDREAGDNEDRLSIDGMSIEGHIIPGAELHPVHRVPDASAPHALHRPLLAEN
jgi:hypothetical protein